MIQALLFQLCEPLLCISSCRTNSHLSASETTFPKRVFIFQSRISKHHLPAALHQLCIEIYVRSQLQKLFQLSLQQLVKSGRIFCFPSLNVFLVKSQILCISVKTCRRFRLLFQTCRGVFFHKSVCLHVRFDVVTDCLHGFFPFVHGQACNDFSRRE